MIGTDEIQVTIGLLKIIAKQFNIVISRETTTKIEGRLISFANKYNKIINFFVNNKVSNLLKDTRDNLFGYPYPEFLYSDKLDQYISALPLNPNIGDEVEILFCDKSTHAQDFSRAGYFKKKMLLKLVNATFANEYKFRYRKLLEYK